MAAWWGGVLLRSAIAHAEDRPLLPEEQPQISKRYTAVLERVQPGYVAPGIDLGSFALSPSIKMSGLYDDNILGTQTDRKADAILRIQPEIVLQSTGERNVLGLDADATIDRYAHHGSEKIADYRVGATDVYRIAHDMILRAAVRIEGDHQSRLSQDIFAQTLKPIHYAKQSAAVAITRDMGRLRLSGDATVARYAYSDGRLADGSVYDQKPSDNLTYRLGMRLSYAQTPSLAWFVRALYNDRDFRTGNATTPERDSHGYQLLAGVDFEPVALMRGSIGIGYITQKYRLPFYTDFAGLGFSAKVQFFPTQLTTVTVEGDREVQDSGIPESGGYLSTNGSIRVDHEFLRQLILGASATYQHNKFNNLDRRDDRAGIGASSTYRMNRTASLELRYDRLDQTSHGADRYRAYTDNRLMFGVTLRR